MKVSVSRGGVPLGRRAAVPGIPGDLGDRMPTRTDAGAGGGGCAGPRPGAGAPPADSMGQACGTPINSFITPPGCVERSGDEGGWCRMQGQWNSQRQGLGRRARHGRCNISTACKSMSSRGPFTPPHTPAAFLHAPPPPSPRSPHSPLLAGMLTLLLVGIYMYAPPGPHAPTRPGGACGWGGGGAGGTPPS